MNLNSNFGIRQETLEGSTTNSAPCQETRQGENRQNPIQGVREETSNANNRPYLQNIHREYSNSERNTSNDRQFFMPQEEQSRGGRKSKAVQIDHVEEQYVIRRNTFSGKNPLCIEDTERPVFVNNYYAGDKPQQMFREVRENFNGKSNNSNFHLQQFQTQALKQDKASQSMDDWDVGIARMHRMEETHPTVENYHNNQDPPVIVQPNKMQELTLSLTRSYQMPDYSVPPPNTHTYKSPPDNSLLPGQHNQAVTVTPNTQGDLNNSLLETIKRVTSAVEQQVILSGARAEHSIIQNNNLFQELIKAQNKRDLDLALMSIPTFTGEDSSQCLDWITRIKNVCVQSGHSLCQELINKAGIVVQNYLTLLDTTLSEKEIEERILQHFSDIPTMTQAIEKLKALRQGENESILAYNQRYKVLAERVEGRPIQEVQSAVAMEMYLGTIIGPLRRNIKNNLFWNSKHAPKNLGEAMKKSEELYVKHLYSSATDQEEEYANKKQQEVVINEVNYGERKDQRRPRYEEKREKSNYRSGYGRSENWNPNRDQGRPSPSDNSKKSLSSQASNVDRHVTWTDTVSVGEKSEKSNNLQTRQNTSSNMSILKGSYTQIMVNPMQLSEHEFTNWMQKLMEARKNRQERKEHPYRSYRKPYSMPDQGTR